MERVLEREEVTDMQSVIRVRGTTAPLIQVFYYPRGNEQAKEQLLEAATKSSRPGVLVAVGEQPGTEEVPGVVALDASALFWRGKRLI